MNVTFYKYTGENNRLNKTLENGVTLECDFNMEYYTITPNLKLYTESCDYNYCYIADINKYYFITNKIIQRNKLYILRLSEDVLMTYKDLILTLYGTVTKTTNYNYLDGNNIPITSKTELKEYSFNDVFNHTGNYVLIGVSN